MKKLLIASVVALAACGEAPKPETPEVEPVSTEVMLALSIANSIEAHPASVDSVLLGNGLTRSGFDSLLYRIAEDSVLSAQYTARRR